MTQTKLGSFIEAVLGTAIGFWISFAVGYVIFPRYGMKVSVSTNIEITLIFTVTSVIRSYVLRRFFNGRLQKLSQQLAGATE